MNKARCVGLVLLAISFNAMALPIDWSGTFGVDYTHINNVRRTKDEVDKNPAAKDGTQGIKSGDNTATFHTYIFKLNPHIIVNDGVSLKGEISTGSIRGGFMGDNSANNSDPNTSGNNSYFFTSPAQRSALNLNQMYAELYADTALIKLGRFSKHYGLGAVFDNGTDAWDRFFTMYDGIEAEMKIGNFSIIPSYSKISTYDEDNNQSQPNGTVDVRETGLIAKYDNKNRDVVVSALYAKRFSESNNSLYNSTTTTVNEMDRGKTEVTIIDIFASKKWNKLNLAFEMPMLSGDYGNVYGNDEKSKISTRAMILDAKYELNPKWLLQLNIGQIEGDKGQTDKFEGMYLHPNYQIAHLMFRYHYPAFNESGKNIFDSSITNTTYLKYQADYISDKWTWKAALIYAKARETARSGSRSYHHEENYSFDSNEEQAKELGYEIDFSADYRWNPNVLITGFYGIWFVGDYYAFTNTGDSLDLINVHGGGLKATVDF